MVVLVYRIDGWFCDGEVLADEDGSSLLSGRQLLQAWYSDGGGTAREFWIQHGVRLRRFCKSGFFVPAVWRATKDGQARRVYRVTLPLC